MTERAKVTPKDFFLWLGAMVALYISIGSFATLLFEYIERLVGVSSVVGYDPYSGAIQFAIASLIVIFPIYLVLTRMLNQDLRRHPEKKELWVRRWLVFLTVFGAGIGMIIDLIVLLTTFLGGEELTTAFLLKVLVIFILFGGVFYYYLQDIRGFWEQNEGTSKTIGIGVLTVVILSIVGGFFIMGSPAAQRELRHDRERISDLETLQFRISDYYADKEELPETLDDLGNLREGSFLPTDPATGESYEYTPTGALTFELCATFARPLPEVHPDAAVLDDYRVQELKRMAANWPHEAGRTCFEREIDPERLNTPGRAIQPRPAFE